MRRLLTALLSLFLVAVPLGAFQPPSGQSEFVPVSQVPAADQLPAAPLVIAAYAFVWVALLLYVWSIWRRLGRVEHDLQALARRGGERSSAR
jgi:CcmD family protein